MLDTHTSASTAVGCRAPNPKYTHGQCAQLPPPPIHQTNSSEWGTGSTDHPRPSLSEGTQGRKLVGTRVRCPSEMHPKAHRYLNPPAPRYPLHMRVSDKGLQKESSGSGNQGQCKHSPGPYSTCHPGEQQRERQAPGRLHTGWGWAPFLS